MTFPLLPGGSPVTRRLRRYEYGMLLGGIAYETLARDGLHLGVRENGMLTLRISNQQAVNVPLKSTLYIKSLPANGLISLGVGADYTPLWDALVDANPRGITDPTRT